jgi:hypothetical protein
MVTNVTNSSELMDFTESMAAFQLLKSEEPHLLKREKSHEYISFGNGPYRRDRKYELPR